MELIKRFRWPLMGAALIVLVVGFLLFRPDKLFIDDTVDESLADAFAPTATMSPPTSVDGTVAPSNSDPELPATTTTAPQPAELAAIGSGAFYGIDHRAEGTATVYEQDGRFVLRFEDDTSIENGPDLFVWVLASDSYDGGEPAEFIDLGKLKGNVGGQNYELPPEYDPTVNQFVLVWCERFGVPFAASPLA